MKAIFYLIKMCFDNPIRWLMVVFLIVFVHLLTDKTFLKMWHLYHNQKILENKIMTIQNKNTLVEEKLKKLSDFRFLEKEVRDRFNFVGKQDIIFIFSDEHNIKQKNKENNE